jgi:hypothetical protein
MREFPNFENLRFVKNTTFSNLSLEKLPIADQFKMSVRDGFSRSRPHFSTKTAEILGYESWDQFI